MRKIRITKQQRYSKALSARVKHSSYLMAMSSSLMNRLRVTLFSLNLKIFSDKVTLNSSRLGALVWVVGSLRLSLRLR